MSVQILSRLYNIESSWLLHSIELQELCYFSYLGGLIKDDRIHGPFSSPISIYMRGLTESSAVHLQESLNLHYHLHRSAAKGNKSFIGLLLDKNATISNNQTGDQLRYTL